MTNLVEVEPADVVATVVNVTTAIISNMTTLRSTVAPALNLSTKMVTSVSTMRTSSPTMNTTTIKDATRLTSISQLPPTEDDMKVFSFDFIDSKKFQERMEDFLAGREASRTSTPATTVAAPVDMSLEDNLGLFIPVIVFGAFLLFIGVCVLWQVLHNRLKLQQKKAGIHGTFHRSHSGSDGSRSSTKSTTPLKTQLSMLNQREFYPRLTRISESPEDRLKVGKLYDPNMLTPDSSFGSILSQLQHELASVVAGNASLGISPYTPLPPPNYFPDVSQSYPSLPVTAQAPFSPYHLAWMTPDPARHMHPDLYMNSSSRPPNIGVAATPPFNNFNDPNGLDRQSNRNLGKSPFHPNNNTPTNGSENDSGALSSNVFVNQISSLSLQPDLSSSLKEAHSASEPELLHSTNQLITPRLLSYNNRSASVAGSGSATPSTECILSGPSNLGSWRYNRLYVGPHPAAVGPQSRLFANYSPAELHALQHNSSLSAVLGNRSSSAVHPDMHNGSCSLPDLPDLVGPTRGCPMYQSDLAAYLHYELSRFAPAPPYEATSHLSAQPRHLPMTSSTNVSTCGQMDSLETSVSDSTITGQVSNNTSGYTAGPSHSTSVMGLTTGQMASLGVPSTHSSFLSNSMSSIMPVNSGATHNTPNTSYANSSYSHRMLPKEGDVSHNATHSSQVLQSSHECSKTSQDLSTGRHSYNTTSSHPAITSSDGDTGSTLTSLSFDEPLGANQSRNASHGNASCTMNQTQHTTAPESISLQWDSLSVDTDSGGATSMLATQGSQDNSNSSATNATGGKVSNQSASKATATSSQTYSSDAPSGTSQETKSSGKGFDWDGFPFYTPSRNDPRRKTMAFIQPGNTGPPPQRPMQRKPSYPVLSSTQYWV